ncbi:MAG TPA: septum formation family protein [Acidimicrobiales bacterium]
MASGRSQTITGVAAGVGLVAAVLLGPLLVFGLGPFSTDGQRVATTDASAGPTTSTTPTSTTDRDPVRDHPVYEAGDCVTWDASAGGGFESKSRAVPCDQPHFLEVTGSFVMKDMPYPKGEGWPKAFSSSTCYELAEAHLGALLDRYGAYDLTGLRPTREEWAQGRRTVACGLARVPLERALVTATTPTAYTGAVSAADRHRHLPRGSCLGFDAMSGGIEAGVTVPCDKPHALEVTGHVDVSGRAQEFPGDDLSAWEPLVGARCTELARSYAGAFRAPVTSAFLPIEPESWKSGRRTVDCVIGENGEDGFRVLERRLGPK